MVVFMDFAATLLEGLDQVAAVLLLLLMLSCIALLVLVLIATWKIFVKVGEKGWKSLIPFYSVYIQCRIAGIPKIFWIYLPVLLLLQILNWAGRRDTGVYGFLNCCNFALQGIYCGYLARAFGKKTGFCIATAFLPVIFLPILGFGSAKYVGAKA